MTLSTFSMLYAAEADRFYLPMVPHYALPQLDLQPRAQYYEQYESSEKRGTEQIPFIVKVIPSERSPEERRRDTDKTEIDRQTVEFTRDLAGYTNRLFWATTGLAAFTGILALAAFFQMRDARKSINAAEVSAMASEQHVRIAERTFIELERAYISGGGVRQNVVYADTRKIDHRFDVHINNYGGTTAELIRFRYGTLTPNSRSIFGQSWPLIPQYSDDELLSTWIEPHRGGISIFKIPITEEAIVIYGRFYYYDIVRHKVFSAGFTHMVKAARDGGESENLSAPRAYTIEQEETEETNRYHRETRWAQDARS
jgi:hypothetical protein